MEKKKKKNDTAFVVNNGKPYFIRSNCKCIQDPIQKWNNRKDIRI